jgi:lambda repressor-like predicted transcriptional regulator
MGLARPGRPLPEALQAALRAAGYARLGDLAEAAGREPRSLYTARARGRIGPATRRRIARLLGIEPEQVDALLFAREERAP